MQKSGRILLVLTVFFTAQYNMLLAGLVLAVFSFIILEHDKILFLSALAGIVLLPWWTNSIKALMVLLIAAYCYQGIVYLVRLYFWQVKKLID